MKSAESAPAHPVSEFSLSEGGPLYTYVLSRLTPFGRFLFPALLGWMPLLILSAWGGAAFDRRLTMPFVLDLPNHVRFLIA
ncbi:MAG: hypothetical protein ACXWP5_13150, partial [Bdellovibrionota bacterium]